MPGFLPQLGDDELIYSVIARYGAMLGQGDGRTLTREFFGSPTNSTAVDLPGGMGQFASRLPEAMDPMVLIQGHTLFPYMFRFAPAELASRARDWLLGGEGKRPPRVGVTAAAFEMPDHLILCPACARADADGGISAWRRTHQIPGVLVCPLHGVALHASQVARQGRRGAAAFVALTPEVVRDAVPCTVTRDQKRDLLDFAQGSARLLDLPAAECDLVWFQHRLRELLRAFRWSRAPSLIASADLAAAFTRDAAVRNLMVAIEVRWTDGQIATALNRLLYREQVAKHPLLVLIVLRLAGATIEDLLAPAPMKPEPGGRVPEVRTKPGTRDDLPCGNPACGLHQGPVVFQPAVLATEVPFHARCPACGFTYSWSPRRPRTAAVVETSPSWDGLLAETLSDPGVSLRAAARRLEVAPTTVMRHARRLGLWRPEWKDRPKVRLNQATKPARLLARHRETWIAYTASGVRVPVKQMLQPTFAAYRYLMQYDRQWMRENGHRRRWPSCGRSIAADHQS